MKSFFLYWTIMFLGTPSFGSGSNTVIDYRSIGHFKLSEKTPISSITNLNYSSTYPKGSMLQHRLLILLGTQLQMTDSCTPTVKLEFTTDQNYQKSIVFGRVGNLNVTYGGFVKVQGIAFRLNLVKGCGQDLDYQVWEENVRLATFRSAEGHRVNVLTELGTTEVSSSQPISSNSWTNQTSNNREISCGVFNNCVFLIQSLNPVLKDSKCVPKVAPIYQFKDGHDLMYGTIGLKNYFHGGETPFYPRLRLEKDCGLKDTFKYKISVLMQNPPRYLSGF